MISPFDTIGEIKANIKEAIGFHNKALGDPEYKAMEKPKWYLAILNSLELAEVFEKHLGPNESAGGLYAEIICGASPSKGCEKCGFYFVPKWTGQTEKRCNFAGSCSPFSP